MRKNVFSFSKLILAVTLAVATMSTVFVGCKNYDDDIKGLQDKVNALSQSVTDLAKKVAEINQPITDAVSIDGGKGIKFTLKDGSTVTLTNQTSTTIPEYTMKPSADGKSVELWKDNTKVSTVAFPATPDFSKVTISDNHELMIDGVGTGIFDNHATFMLKGPDFITISMPNKDGKIETANIPYYNASSAVTSITVFDNFDYGVSYFKANNEVLWDGPKAVVATEGANKGKKVMQAGIRAGVGTPVLMQINPASAKMAELPMPVAYDSKKGAINVSFSDPVVFEDGYVTRTAKNTGLWRYTTQLNVALNAKEADLASNLYAKTTAPLERKGFAVNFGTEIQSQYDLAIDLYKGSAVALNVDYDNQIAYINEALEVKPTYSGKATFADILGTSVTGMFPEDAKDYIFDQYIKCEDPALFEQYAIKIEGMKITATKGVGTKTEPVTFTYNAITLDGAQVSVMFDVTFKENLGKLDAALSPIKLSVPYGTLEPIAKRTAYTSLTPMWDKIKAAGQTATWAATVVPANTKVSVTSPAVGIAVSYVMNMYAEAEKEGTLPDFYRSVIAAGLINSPSDLDFTKADAVKTAIEAFWAKQIALDYGVYDATAKSWTAKTSAADWKDIQAQIQFNLLMPNMIPYIITASFNDKDAMTINKVTIDYTIELGASAFTKVPARWFGEKVIAYGNPELFAADGYIAYPFNNAVTNLSLATDLYDESVPEGKAAIFAGKGLVALDGGNTAVLDNATSAGKGLILILKDSLEVTRTVKAVRQYAVDFNAAVTGFNFGAFNKEAQTFELEARSPIFDGTMQVKSGTTLSIKYNSTKPLYILGGAFTAESKYGGAYEFLSNANFNDGIKPFDQVISYAVKATGANAPMITVELGNGNLTKDVDVAIPALTKNLTGVNYIKITPKAGEQPSVDAVIPIEVKVEDAWGKTRTMIMNVTVLK